MTPKVKIRKGDQVIMLTGRDRKKTGEVVAVFPRENKALVNGIGMVKRHQRPDTASPGGIVEKETKIDISNLALVDPKTGEPARVHFRVLEDGRKVRASKKSGEVIG